MDTNFPSPNHASSSIVSGILSTILSVGAVAWVIGGAAGVATAQTSPAKTEAAHVVYSDLNLSTEDGAKTLLRRVNAAANEACGANVHSPLLPRTATQHDRCVAVTTQSAIDSIGSLTVAQVHRSETAGTLVAAR